MNKKLILHIGTPKTGTSSIQGFMKLNKEKLAQRGFEYPIFSKKWPGIGQPRNAHFLYRCALTLGGYHREDPRPGYAEACLEEFGALVRACDGTMVLSDETLWQMASRFKKSVPALKRILDGYGFDKYQVIVYLRRQDTFIESQWNQQIKASGVGSKTFSSTFEAYSNRGYANNVCNYDRTLKRLEKEFGQENITVRIYDRSQLVGQDSVADFLDVLGLDIADFDQLEAEANDGIKDRTLLELKRLINKAPSYTEAGNYLLPAIVSLGKDKPKEETAVMSPEERGAFLDRYAEGNANIAQRYFERDELFGPDKVDGQPKWELNPEELLADAIVVLSEAAAADRVRLRDAEKKIEKLSRELEQGKRQTFKSRIARKIHGKK